MTVLTFRDVSKFSGVNTADKVREQLYGKIKILNKTCKGKHFSFVWLIRNQNTPTYLTK